jgi:predicted DsbA family dithiol-disulfide isomerase
MINRNAANRPQAADARSFATLQVDMIADLVCPWCYLGKRRLDDALSAVHGPSTLTWYPFQLNPEMPDAGMAFDEYLAARFGDPVALQPALAELTLAGKAEGVNFRFDRLARVPNTLNAHRVMRLAETEGASASGLAENFLKGFFEDGLNLSDRDVLLDIGARGGLSPQSINKTLDDETSRRIVLSQEAQVRKSGVTGVPNFLVNKRLFVIGAQSTDALVTVFDRAMFGGDGEQPEPPVFH